MSTAKNPSERRPKVWWSNAIFFLSIHFAAFYGIYRRPYWTVSTPSLLLALVIWQLSCFGITVGYHRLYSHRAFRATLPIRIVLAALGAMGFQGSIKWWCLRHRLHHRFTDDPVHDPYAASRGLFFSHMGWIFFKPKYEKLDEVDKDDLDNDPVVTFQHTYYVPIAIALGFVMPWLFGALWGDATGSFIWGGLVSRLAIWHCTFCVNSLAHWEGLQPYTDENTSRGNVILAILTCGEGNHNFHAFPHDFRSGPSKLDWDPSKWIIVALDKLGLAHELNRARDKDIQSALSWMKSKHHHDAQSSSSSSESSSGTSDEGEDSETTDELPLWTERELSEYVGEGKTRRCVLVINERVVDVSVYLNEHPGGPTLLRKYAYKPPGDSKDIGRNATWAFMGGMNKHSRAANRRLQEITVARMAEASQL
ncbi:putative stearoyl-CoA desaturase [Schizopora paradoxa]|uniref:Acyl-CoA desaturase n=1 Tax=Schizopora paradoxa TaxID=27342 RepID=A0A0H2RQM1_9AGAM|nr:putative stearoyl-CoA desaturase [Schizopora paradoxa]